MLRRLMQGKAKQRDDLSRRALERTTLLHERFHQEKDANTQIMPLQLT